MLVAAALLLALPPSARAEPQNAFEPDFVVNTYTTGARELGYSSFAADGAGDFVVVWSQAPSLHARPTALVAQRLDRTGARLGTEFEVVSFTGDNWLDGEREFQVHARPAGGFVVSWEEDGPGLGTNNRLLRVRSFDSTGVQVGADTTLQAYYGNVSRPAPLSGDMLTVHTTVSETSQSDVYVQRIDASGALVGTEFQVNSYTSFYQNAGHATSFGNGNFMVTWTHTTDNFDDGDGVKVASWDTHGRVFDASGAPIGPDFQVSSTNSGGEFSRSALRTPDGNALILFSRHFGAVDGLYGRAFDATGTPLGDEFFIVGTECWPYWGARGAAIDGNDVLGYGCPRNGQYENMHLYAYDLASHLPVGQVFLRRSLIGDELSSSTAGDPLGGFLVALTRASPVAQPDESDLVVRRVCDPADPDCNLCLGFDDSADEDGDGTPDGCDPCAVVGPPYSFDRIAVSARFAGYDSKGADRGRNRLQLRSTVQLPVPVVDLDPTIDGMRVRVETVTGAPLADAELPGGVYAGGKTRGWKLKGASGGGWRYVDRTGAAMDGIYKVVVIAKAQAEPNSVRVKIKGKKSVYVVHESFSPLKATLFPAGTGGASAGNCMEHAFSVSACESTRGDRTECEE